MRNHQWILPPNSTPMSLSFHLVAHWAHLLLERYRLEHDPQFVPYSVETFTITLSVMWHRKIQNVWMISSVMGSSLCILGVYGFPGTICWSFCTLLPTNDFCCYCCDKKHDYFTSVFLVSNSTAIIMPTVSIITIPCACARSRFVQVAYRIFVRRGIPPVCVGRGRLSRGQGIISSFKVPTL